MRTLVVCVSLLGLSACNRVSSNPPPAGRAYYPGAIRHVAVPGSSLGALVFVNVNHDRRYSSGSLSAVALDEVGLPEFGQAVDGGPVALTNLGSVRSVKINNFGGELGVLDRGGGRLRFFVASSDEGNKVQGVDAVLDGGVTLSCFPAGPEDEPDHCGTNAPSASPIELERTPGAVPRASAPYGVSVRARVCSPVVDCGEGRSCVEGTCHDAEGGVLGDVYVTHMKQVDSPQGSGTNLRAYLLQLDSDRPVVDASSFIGIGVEPSFSSVTGERWTYVTGKEVCGNTCVPGNLLRLVDRTGRVLTSALESSFAMLATRGVALGSGERRLYLLGRYPDVLVVLALASVTSDTPSLRLIREIPLAFAPQQLTVIARPGRGDLVAVTYEGTGTGRVAGGLLLYDEEAGELVANVDEVGLQPFGVTASRIGAGARLFVSNYGDGRIAVIDVPNLDRPQEARVVAHLGTSQLCLTQLTPPPGCEEGP